MRRILDDALFVFMSFVWTAFVLVMILSCMEQDFYRFG